MMVRWSTRVAPLCNGCHVSRLEIGPKWYFAYYTAWLGTDSLSLCSRNAAGFKNLEKQLLVPTRF